MGTPPGDRHTPSDLDPTSAAGLSLSTSAQIGPYRLLERVGAGGMGEVWLAEQRHPVRRQVALKVIKAGMDTREVIARFEAERQALAMMNHPNIAGVYDAGATPEGRPYFAMEYVHGIPITDFCDKHRLSIPERLALFVDVCAGVQHAHQKGIIHRDIKPSNVLVTTQDEKHRPKIIDFGVAKATSQRLTERTVFTELGQLIGTPEYMSPEQAEMTNLDIDTRTDVYSLGVLLYELLAGARPFDSKELRRAGLAEIQRTLREEEPPRPSSRVSGLGAASTSSATNRRADLRALTKALEGDLDWITMKALEKDRLRRYETAHALALDVERHLHGEAVLAGPPSGLYRVKKLVNRHRGAFVSAGAVVLALIAGIIGTSWALVQAKRAERQAAASAVEARRQTAIAESVNTFLSQDLLAAVAPSARRGHLAEVEKLIAEQYKGKEKLLEPNIKALHMGRDYAASYLPSINLKVKRANAVGNKIFLEGNSAAALGCVFGGATVAAWYPITPSSSLAEAFARHCRKFRHDPDTGKARYAIIQAEDELASIGMVIGAAWNGARSFTCTSGPGISLMQEFIGLAYFAEIPAVIFDVQRGGPSTGMPTRTQQSDVLACAYASHGDTKHVLLFPEDPKEAFDFGAEAFDLAERLQTPVFVLLDLDIGMNERLCDPLSWDDTKGYDRGKVMTAEELEAGKEFGRYLDVDGDGIAYRTYPGTHPTRGSFFTRGTTKDRYARYSEAGPDYVENMQRLLRKFETAKELVPQPVVRRAQQATRLGVIYFGSTSPAMHEALDAFDRDGVHIDAMRIRAFPFPEDVYDFIADHDQVFVVEQNRDAQLRMLLVNEGTADPGRLISVLHFDGTPITARFIIGEIAEKVAVLKVAPLRVVR